MIYVILISTFKIVRMSVRICRKIQRKKKLEEIRTKLTLAEEMTTKVKNAKINKKYMHNTCHVNFKHNIYYASIFYAMTLVSFKIFQLASIHTKQEILLAQTQSILGADLIINQLDNLLSNLLFLFAKWIHILRIHVQ